MQGGININSLLYNTTERVKPSTVWAFPCKSAIFIRFCNEITGKWFVLKLLCLTLLKKIPIY